MYLNWIVETNIILQESAELTLGGRGCSTPAV